MIVEVFHFIDFCFFIDVESHARGWAILEEEGLGRAAFSQFLDLVFVVLQVL